MAQFSRAGYEKTVQVLVRGAAFGLAHDGCLNQGSLVWLGIMVPTAFLGMMWGINRDCALFEPHDSTPRVALFMVTATR